MTHRLLVLALLAGRKIEVVRPLIAEDTRLMLGALAELGWAVERDEGLMRLEPPATAVGEATIDCGSAGTMLRFLCAALTAVPGRWRVDGSCRLRERPIGPLLEALRGLGARIDCPGREGFAPLEITGGTLSGGRVALVAAESSQYLSALLLAATSGERPVEIQVSSLVSAPYVQLTLDALSQFDVSVTVDGSSYRLEPGLASVRRVEVDGDYSAAAYAAAGAALTGGQVVIEGLDRASSQGDRRFLDVLAGMGARVGWDGRRVDIGGVRELTAVDVDFADMPDQVPTLAALAPFAHGTTRIRNVAHLRLKESDRLAVMRRELERIGAGVVEHADGLSIPGLWAESRPPDTPVTVQPQDDHRIAMSLALVGLRRAGLTVADPAVVEKSYPDFWVDLDRLLVG